MQWNSRGYVRYKNKQVMGMWVPPPTDDIPYEYYQVEIDDVGRLDNVAQKVYGDDNYFWVIAAFNSILDPFNGFIAGQVLKIPNLGTYLQRWKSYGFTG